MCVERDSAAVKKLQKNALLNFALSSVDISQNCAHPCKDLRSLEVQHSDGKQNKIRGHSTTTWTRRGGGGVSQKSTLVHSGGKNKDACNFIFDHDFRHCFFFGSLLPFPFSFWTFGSIHLLYSATWLCTKYAVSKFYTL